MSTMAERAKAPVKRREIVNPEVASSSQERDGLCLVPSFNWRHLDVVFYLYFEVLDFFSNFYRTHRAPMIDRCSTEVTFPSSFRCIEQFSMNFRYSDSHRLTGNR